MQRTLVLIGLLLLLLGLVWPWLRHLPFGRLPGDIVIQREGFTFYLPVTSMILLSLVLSLLAWWWRR